MLYVNKYYHLAEVMIKIDFHMMNTCKRADAYIFSIKELKRNINHIMNQYIYDCNECCINISSFTRTGSIHE